MRLELEFGELPVFPTDDEANFDLMEINEGSIVFNLMETEDESDSSSKFPFLFSTFS